MGMTNNKNIITIKLRIMKEEKTKNYEAPLVEIIEVEVEKGFADSFSANGNPFGDGWNSETELN